VPNNHKYLKLIANECARKIQNAARSVEYFDSPFKHLALDNFLPTELAERCLEYFPDIDGEEWEHENIQDIEVKYRTTWQSEFDITAGLVDSIKVMNSAPILHAKSYLLAIPELMPGPYFTRDGLNVKKNGGLVGNHVNGNYHDASGLRRILNALLYLNKDWTPDWGGEFGLYAKNSSVCLKKVSPLFNRLVIFATHDYSFHGLPDPINFPEDTPRRSIILYYYTKDPRPSELIAIDKPHSALWVKKNLIDKRGIKKESLLNLDEHDRF
jgi:hypothetical protein